MTTLVGTSVSSAAASAGLQPISLWPWAIRVWATELGPRGLDGRGGGPVPVTNGWYGTVGTVPIELFGWRQPVLAGADNWDDWAAAIGPRPADWLSMMTIVGHLTGPAGRFRLGIRYVDPDLIAQGLPSNQHFKLAEADEPGARLLAAPAVRTALAPVSTDFVTLADRAVLVHVPLRDRTAEQLTGRIQLAAALAAALETAGQLSQGNVTALSHRDTRDEPGRATEPA